MIKVNNSWLTQRTGDPFTDTGGWVIDWLWKQPEHEQKDISQLIEFIAKHYVNDWKGKLHSFFLNSPITNPANKGREVSEVVRYFSSLINETEQHEMGYCRILGEYTKLFSAGRHNSPLSGSTAFLNFHHNFQSGLMLSKEALIRIFFLPYGTQVVGGFNAALSANEPKIERRYVYEICRENNRRVASRNTEGGVLKSVFTNPANALFDFARKCLEVDVRDDEIIEMNLIHYTNFAAKPESNLYCFSAQLFDFYRKVMQDSTKKDWKRFSHSFHRLKAATYDDVNDRYEVVEKKEKRVEDFDEFQKWYNPIYDKLLRGQPILSDFRDWSKRQLLAKKKPFQIYPIVKLYQKHLFDMKEETLQKIEAIAAHIVRDAKTDPTKVGRRVTQVRRAKHESDIRGVLIPIIKEQYEKGEKTPIVTVREYVNVLFPDGVYGTTVKDLLLISIYEKLMAEGVPVDEGSDDAETESNS